MFVVHYEMKHLLFILMWIFNLTLLETDFVHVYNNISFHLAEVAYYSPHMKGEIPGNCSFNVQLKVSPFSSR